MKNAGYIVVWERQKALTCLTLALQINTEDKGMSLPLRSKAYVTDKNLKKRLLEVWLKLRKEPH